MMTPEELDKLLKELGDHVVHCAACDNGRVCPVGVELLNRMLPEKDGKDE